MSKVIYKNSDSGEQMLIELFELDNGRPVLLKNWTQSLGAVYRRDEKASSIVSIKENGVALTPVAGIPGVIKGTYYHDKTNKRIYLQTTRGNDPITVNLEMVFRYKQELAPYIEVIWDEDEDGNLSTAKKAQLGGLVRESDGSLSFDAAMFAAHQQKKTDAASAKSSMAAIKAKFKSRSASLDEVQDFLATL